MTHREENYALNIEMLNEYQEYALLNASELLAEAMLLLKNKFYARAYFLGCASIEETGKGFLAFSAKGRNLNNQGVHKKFRDIVENHHIKVSSAFICWVNSSSNKEEAVKAMLDLCFHLKYGRESSMYVDIDKSNSVTKPSKNIRPISARDCVKVAEHCYIFTNEHTLDNHPVKTTTFDDKLFCMSSKNIRSIFNNDDFGEYLLSVLKNDGSNLNISKYITTYNDTYFCKDKKFKN